MTERKAAGAKQLDVEAWQPRVEAKHSEAEAQHPQKRELPLESLREATEINAS